jgi:hypothetical protein
MEEFEKELNMQKSFEIPNSYLYQPESEINKWMQKRGK